MATNGMKKRATSLLLNELQKSLKRTCVIKEKELAWPQHFDGKGWENQFALRYGIFGIPTMWLVDKRGNLRDTNARFDLERRVTAMLKEQTADSK
jgi:hypothetical protein